MIKNNAKRFAKEVYGTSSPTPEQINAAKAFLTIK